MSLKSLVEGACQNNKNVELYEALGSFICDKDSAIQEFLNKNALDFLERNLCSIYLILDKEAFDNKKLKIEAYFALLHKAIRLNNDVSKSKKKKLAGSKEKNLASVVLIGQLGKFINCCGDVQEISDITIAEIVSFVNEVIASANQYIPCRFAMVECSEQLHQKGVYKNVGFTYLQKDNNYHQYYKVIN